MSERNVYESGPCRQCSVCEGGPPHHWRENSVDPDDDEAREAFLSEHPQFKDGTSLTSGNAELTDELLLAHWECAHCPAVREYDPDEDEDEI